MYSFLSAMLLMRIYLSMDLILTWKAFHMHNIDSCICNQCWLTLVSSKCILPFLLLFNNFLTLFIVVVKISELIKVNTQVSWNFEQHT